MSQSATQIRVQEMKAQHRLRILSENPEALPECVANHYAGMATTAQALMKLTIFEARSPSDSQKELIQIMMKQIYVDHVSTFGLPPNWPLKVTER